MGSANGRHRRPRQAPAIVVTAGVTGSAIAIPLLGAAGAHAADATTWDRVAECESGGMWSADLGNGFYGGLQFSQGDWKAYGGEAYAPRADLASRSQQIAVAEKVLDDRGPKEWPSCAVISGLTEDGSLPGVDPGIVPSAEPAESGDASEAPSTEASATPSGKASHKPSATPSSKKSDSSESPQKSGSSDNGVGGKHRGAPASEVSHGMGRGGDRDSGRHASRGNSAGRDTRAAATDGDYTVRPGDNLWAIADAQKVPGGWPALYEANKGAVGGDPDLILPGQSLDLGVKSK
ncbi:transglycosylase family protein [Streptomyces sp. NBC_01320]|uniref:transglycosylase family protein n=1 Tax=Streptomyces sp. NBC_01320 TaxID=2903824 RepID=UPI002E1051DE|nr:LysM peptidoglycan-binding domain-containing protein [Streptomyces sp. NBC_01320]